MPEPKTQKGLEKDKNQQNKGDRASSIHDKKKHSSISPVLILDIDRGLDFTFDGLGLKGNRG